MGKPIDIAVTPMAQWSGVENRPLLIAGPCSAESPDQMRAVARRLAGQRVDYYRAGIWKPRTRPGNFEGMGDTAVPWLADIRREFGIRTATEVATPQHVEVSLKHGIDLLWVGARTTVSPFAVQELANALRGSTVPVLVKNPTSPDIGLWFGALERIAGAGVKMLGVIHRGFSIAGTSRFRNVPLWEMVIEFRRTFPHIPVINDPSHISGRRDLIQEVSQSALDLGLDGLMIETHSNPDQAWSDAEQQITPERLGDIMARVKVRRSGTQAAAFNAALEGLRDEIDHVDREMLDLLAQRMRIVERIAESKSANNVAPLQVDRWRAMLAERMARAEAIGLTRAYAQALYEVIHSESVRRQSELISGTDGAAPDEHA